MTNYREILRLHSLGLNKTEIAASCQCARNTVADLPLCQKSPLVCKEDFWRLGYYLTPDACSQAGARFYAYINQTKPDQGYEYLFFVYSGAMVYGAESQFSQRRFAV